KATSNICTNQALIALMANVFMTVYGKAGLKELARHNLAKTAYAAQQFGKHANAIFPGTPRFNEFVIQTSEDPYAINSRLLGRKNEKTSATCPRSARSKSSGTSRAYPPGITRLILACTRSALAP